MATTEHQLNLLMYQLASEIGDSKTFRSTVEIIFKIHRNILHNPGDKKYCVLKLTNETILKVWRYKAVKSFLNTVGWVEEVNMLEFKGGEHLELAVKILTDFRLVAPSEHEWVAETKLEDLTLKEREENKKREAAAKERDKEVAKFFKDKREHEQIADNIRKQIKADQEYRRSIPFLPQVPKRKTQSVASKSAATAATRRVSEPSLSIQGKGVHPE